MMKYSHLGIALLAVATLCLPASSQLAGPESPAFAAASRYAASVTATESANPADEPVLTIKKRVDEVNVLFIATDRHGKFVRNLNQGDFSILDDHKPVQSIVNFRRETEDRKSVV